MAKFRLESVFDHASGLYYVEVYYPDDAGEPLVTTDPRYQSHEEAEVDSIRIFQDAFKNQPVEASR